MPASAIPLAYYLFAHAALALGFVALVVDPALPGASFYHPRMVALVHLLTLAWMSGSILGSFYIVGPLALRIPMPGRTPDWIAFTAFALGTTGMIAGFWNARYDAVGWSASLVTSAIAWVGWCASRGFRASPAPAGVLLHVALAFTNMLLAAGLGILVALDRSRGFLGISPLAATFAHAHLAAVGWGLMMVVGLSYRLIPMMLPAAMPTGRSLALSAVLIESGLTVIVVTLLGNLPGVFAGALLVAAGLASFVVHIRKSAARRMPRPPALPCRDWSTWQAHIALLWLLIALGLGIALSVGVSDERRLTVMWIYGAAGLVGFLGQIVTGMQGRLVPFYAWYRAFGASGEPPARAANALPSPAFALTIFAGWTVGAPVLTYGLAFEHHAAIAISAAVLAASVLTGAAYLRHMLKMAL